MSDDLSQFIDISTFEKTLYHEASIAFAAMIAEYKSEKIYMLGFYHSGCYSYLFPIALTEADLVDCPDLRWSEGDASHHCEYEEAINQTDALLHGFSETIIYGDNVNEYIDERSDEENKKKVTAYYHFIEQSVANVFAQLEKEGVFDEMDDRDSYILNLVCGDQSWDDKLSYAKRINPKSALVQLTSDVESRNKATSIELA